MTSVGVSEILGIGLIAVASLSTCDTRAEEPPLRTKEVPGVQKVRLLPPGPGNPRNSEGDFIETNDGRVLFVYSHFTGGGSDHATGHLAGRWTEDGGVTWSSNDVVVVPREGEMNNMSVSLVRLASGEIALFYLVKNSLTDCRPVLRISSDEARTWSDPIPCIPDEIGYYVMNNDRAVQLRSGRLVLPVALHNTPEQEQPDWTGRVLCYLSDDGGKSWRRGEMAPIPTRDNGKRLITQEPGVVELNDGSLLMFIRSDAGSQLFSRSGDGGETWSRPEPSSLASPVSPATIERIPSTGDLLVAWNDHDGIPKELAGKRTPFAVALSRDEGATWETVDRLEDDPHGWYCYTAMTFVDDHVLLGHCAGDRKKGGLNTTQITRFPVSWLYGR